MSDNQQQPEVEGAGRLSAEELRDMHDRDVGRRLAHEPFCEAEADRTRLLTHIWILAAEIEELRADTRRVEAECAAIREAVSAVDDFLGEHMPRDAEFAHLAFKMHETLKFTTAGRGVLAELSDLRAESKELWARLKAGEAECAVLREAAEIGYGWMCSFPEDGKHIAPPIALEVKLRETKKVGDAIYHTTAGASLLREVEELRAVLEHASRLADALDYEKERGRAGFDTGLRVPLLLGMKLKALRLAVREAQQKKDQPPD